MSESSSIKLEERRTLIFKGGGVKGIAYAAAVDVLISEGLRFEVYAGTSAGAIAAALLACGYDASKIGDILRSPSAFPPRRLVAADGIWGLPGGSIMSLLFRGYLYDGRHFRQWLHDLMRKKLDRQSNDAIKFRDLPEGIELKIFASHSRNGTQMWSRATSPNFVITDAVRASMSIPLVFRASEDHSARFYDGGLTANFPVEETLAQGDTPFVALHIDEPGDEGDGRPSVFPLMNAILESLETMLRGRSPSTLERYEASIVRIDTRHVHTVDFDLSDSDAIFLSAAGRAAAYGYLSRYKPELVDRAELAREEAEVARCSSLERRRTDARWSIARTIAVVTVLVGMVGMLVSWCGSVHAGSTIAHVDAGEGAPHSGAADSGSVHSGEYVPAAPVITVPVFLQTTPVDADVYLDLRGIPEVSRRLAHTETGGAAKRVRITRGAHVLTVLANGHEARVMSIYVLRHDEEFHIALRPLCSVEFDFAGFPVEDLIELGRACPAPELRVDDLAFSIDIARGPSRVALVPGGQHWAWIQCGVAALRRTRFEIDGAYDGRERTCPRSIPLHLEVLSR